MKLGYRMEYQEKCKKTKDSSQDCQKMLTLQSNSDEILLRFENLTKSCRQFQIFTVFFHWIHCELMKLED